MSASTTELNKVLTWNVTKVASFAASLQFKVLSVLIRWTRKVLRFRQLEQLEKYLHAWSRDFQAKALDLPPVTHADVERIETLIPVPDDPNVMLTGTLFLPRNRGAQKLPAVLIRTPYDRHSPLLGPRFAEIFAERGYGCMMQDTRGRFGSGGDFFPIVHEVNDGGTTVAWLRAQEWCSGKVGTFGISYLGMTSYASSSKERVDACAPIMAASRLYPVLFHGGHTFSFDLIVRWLWLVMNLMMDRNPFSALFKVLTSEYQLHSALHPAGDTPIHHRDKDIVGKELHFYRDVYQSNQLQHEFWQEKDVLCDLSQGTTRPPLTIVAGWFDFFSRQSFADYLVASKSSPQTPLKLICGSWCHFDLLQYSPLGFSTAFELFEAELKCGENGAVVGHKPHELILHLVHSETEGNSRGTWLKFHSWPPSNVQERMFSLKSHGRLELAGSSSEEEEKDGYTENHYDPENPTPHVGGLSFNWGNSGIMRQNELESRNDVATFTSGPMAQDTTVVGDVRLTLNVWSNNKHTDFFIKLCNVGEDGKSLNVLEKITRLSPTNVEWDEHGNCKLDVDMGPIAALFRKGHALRLQISGGAHPAYLRHPGVEDHNSTALRTADRRIMHSTAQPSSLVVPILL